LYHVIHTINLWYVPCRALRLLLFLLLLGKVLVALASLGLLW
jgi:hypothetical protein